MEMNGDSPGRILASGEDALAVHALTRHLSSILGQLRDPTPPVETILIVKPSFGRHGKGADGHTSGAAKPEFGEIDAILGTRQAIYLLESRWSAPGDAKTPSFAMREDVLHRHRILRWYLDAWKSQQPRTWGDFVATGDRDFRLRFPGARIAPEGSVLAAALQFVLSQLAHCGGHGRDVLLYLRGKESPPPPKGALHGFALVTVTIESLRATGYFDMRT